jgi:hypothetical protein
VRHRHPPDRGAGARDPAPATRRRALACALLVSLPATAVVATANGLSGVGWPENLAVLFVQFALLLAAISLPVYTLADLREAVESSATPREAAQGDNPPTGLALFKSRLSGPLEGRLLCLEIQDHYLAVHTTAGSDLILCRMEDAARAWRPRPARAKSWWVAGDVVDGVEREGQRVLLRLSDGRRVPVGRTYRDGLRREGFLTT